MRKPNFFIIGAPKCGTTSLAMWLSSHPQIFMSPVKEPHFFIERKSLRCIQSLDEYEALFVGAGKDHLAIGEASTQYLYTNATSAILSYNPDAKFLVCIRNPVEMAPSLHAQRFFRGMETVKDFEKAWRLQEQRIQGYHIPITARIDPELLQYGEYCKLGTQLTRVYQQVSKEKILVLILDDLMENPLKEYQKICSFLGVDTAFIPDFQIYNSRMQTRSKALSVLSVLLLEIKQLLGISQRTGLYTWFNKLNRVPASTTEIPVEMKRELIEYFRDEILLLQDLLHRDFRHWLQIPQ